jgi:hypothetical protein
MWWPQELHNSEERVPADRSGHRPEPVMLGSTAGIRHEATAMATIAQIRNTWVAANAMRDQG